MVRYRVIHQLTMRGCDLVVSFGILKKGLIGLLIGEMAIDTQWWRCDGQWMHFFFSSIKLKFYVAIVEVSDKVSRFEDLKPYREELLYFV